jgi:small subunit ribosomal protein S20
MSFLLESCKVVKLKGLFFEAGFNIPTLQHSNLTTKFPKQLTIKKIHPIFAVRKIKEELATMANHKSSIKRIRANAAKRLRNRYQAKTTRNAIKKLRDTTSKEEATPLLTKVISMLDRLAKKNVIHKNKASNNKSKLTKFVNNLK